MSRMSRPKERRLKLLRISTELQPDKYAMIAMMRELPEDATIQRFGNDSYAGVILMIIHSMTFEVVPEGTMLPYLEIQLDRHKLAAAQDETYVREYLAPGEEVVRFEGADVSKFTKAEMEEAQRKIREAVMQGFSVTPHELGTSMPPRRWSSSQGQPQTLPRECQCDIAYNGGHRPGCRQRK